MANYLCEAHGLLADAFPWSFRMYMISSDSEATVETNWHASVKAAWDNASFLALIPASTHFTGTSSSTLDAAWKQTTKTSTDEDIVGTGGAALPFSSALIVTWRTALASKKGHGRSYWPGLDVSSLDTSGYFYKSTTLAAAVGAMNAMTGSWAGVLTPVILHRKTLTTDNITHGDIPDLVAVQTRRADKRVPIRSSLAAI
jgi:hypothetical protein